MSQLPTARFTPGFHASWDVTDFLCAGTILSDHGLFLQSPDWKDPESRYHNPQVYTFIDLPDEDTWLDELGLYSTSSDRVEENTDWAVVLDHLPQHRTLSISVDPTLIEVELMESVVPLKHCPCPLANVRHRHQLEGLDFMLRREIGQLDESLRYCRLAASDQGVPVFKHVVTKDEVNGEPAEPPSGILADDMGLGKTLTTLALIANSKARAANFATKVHNTLIHTKATLVVLPSMCKIIDSRSGSVLTGGSDSGRMDKGIGRSELAIMKNF
ncbi:hypothetical protein HII31_01732 [Pseudocercospora fuligena]|uniref:SNF2 N-terminal domain-containing protein n=1 Tax=Pseudocercospora fuligena TaxID=685502 RepID=A0A8H6VQH9_9PEZI|nr:hypothetical protein HII31_01732 [Pseudocercospora fuligena]